ncbi:hypothetical protein CupriaWKF_00285 [Cupriavidus sp. WKF15]|uniref:hypothetical protein n=1 Tax=Cupriavidus sp. WKF15 TaxID=3032282 RepID=UPI0023E2A993|nr:hypothetical protein [Cupriavidus sp. WKF15]WER46064.1 hypothetical protein CupriaWKF_00285 [Cupriavidus sp. WKF15]
MQVSLHCMMSQGAMRDDALRATGIALQRDIAASGHCTVDGGAAIASPRCAARADA